MKCCLRMSKRKGVNSCSKGLHLNAGREQIELETSTFPRCKTPCHYHCSSPIIFLFLFFNQPLNCNAQLSVSLAVSFVQSTSSPFPPHQSPQLIFITASIYTLGGSCPFPFCWEFFISLNHAQFLLMISPYWTILLTCWFVVPWVQLMAEEREAGGPLCIIAMSFSFLVSVPILETVRLNLFQETLLSAPHLVGMFPAVKKRKNKLRLQQHPTAFYRSNQEILKGYWTGRKIWRVWNCFYIYIF